MLELPEEKSVHPVLAFLKSDKVWYGLILGCLAPFLGFYLYYQMQFSDHVSLPAFLRFIRSPGLLSKVVSLSVLINLPLFFYFIRVHRDFSAKGILGATLVYAALIAYLKFVA